MSFIDTSIEDFFQELYQRITNNNSEDCCINFEYKNLPYNNELFTAVLTYKNNGTIFYSKFLSDYPKYDIISIRNIYFNQNTVKKMKEDESNGIFYLKFTVNYKIFYDKT